MAGGYNGVQQQFFQKSNLLLKEGWIQNFWKQEYEMLGVNEQEELVQGLVLMADLRECCEKGAFSNVHTEGDRRRFVKGLFIMQINDVVNIHAAYKSRYNENDNKRCLKLMLCDGEREFVGIEHQKCPELSVNMAAGTKILLTNPQISANKIFFRPQNVKVLGGNVNYLEQARQRVYTAWQQPLKFGENVGQEEKYQKAMQNLVDAARKVDEQQITDQQMSVVEEINDWDFMLQYEQEGDGTEGGDGIGGEQQMDDNEMGVSNDEQNFENLENLGPEDNMQQQQFQQRRQSLDQILEIFVPETQTEVFTQHQGRSVVGNQEEPGNMQLQQQQQSLHYQQSQSVVASNQVIISTAETAIVDLTGSQ